MGTTSGRPEQGRTKAHLWGEIKVQGECPPPPATTGEGGRYHASFVWGAELTIRSDSISTPTLVVV